MDRHTSKLEPSGRLLIPAALRQKLNLVPGAEMIIEEDEGILHIHTRQAAIRKVQQYFAQFDNGRSMSEELLKERKAEAAREKST
jgi:bifunctional DNA-binding transcriptional regulator/antitoxin component of YhaV-PrlF toxin-antitoxin module